MQCGIACLQMICSHFGREYSLDSLSRICFATAEGVSLLGINEAAKILGLETLCARVSSELSYQKFLFLAFSIGIKTTS